jgi:hypothetical protein
MKMKRRGWRPGAPALLVATALGCGSGDIVYYPDHAGGTGGAGGSSDCPGQCVPLGPAEWNGPALLWIGKAGDAPECPPSAPIVGSPVFDNLSAANVCGSCACDAPAGSCALSTTITAHDTASCPAPTGATATTFDAPPGWNGACTAENAIPAGKKCAGGDCVQSLTIAPLTLTEGPCGVSTSAVAAKAPYAWATEARTCHGLTEGTCRGPSEICAAAVAPGFAQCLVREGDKECPVDYPVKHVFYDRIDDTRGCSPCACSAPSGSTCKSIVSVYNDSACSTFAFAAPIDATAAGCLDILPSGQALGSKVASAPVYAPGVCQATGGKPIGDAAPAEPSTFCCLL